MKVMSSQAPLKPHKTRRLAVYARNSLVMGFTGFHLHEITEFREGPDPTKRTAAFRRLHGR